MTSPDTTAPLRTDCSTCHHSLDDHTQGLRCKICKNECGFSSKAFEYDQWLRRRGIR